MAIPRVKATYTLDPATIELLQRVARRWGVSKSEALGRAIRAAAAAPAPPDARLELLTTLQRTTKLTAHAADEWQSDVRAERRATRKR